MSPWEVIIYCGAATVGIAMIGFGVATAVIVVKAAWNVR